MLWTKPRTPGDTADRHICTDPPDCQMMKFPCHQRSLHSSFGVWNFSSSLVCCLMLHLIWVFQMPVTNGPLWLFMWFYCIVIVIYYCVADKLWTQMQELGHRHVRSEEGSFNAGDLPETEYKLIQSRSQGFTHRNHRAHGVHRAHSMREDVTKKWENRRKTEA